MPPVAVSPWRQQVRSKRQRLTRWPRACSPPEREFFGFGATMATMMIRATMDPATPKKIRSPFPLGLCGGWGGGGGGLRYWPGWYGS